MEQLPYAYLTDLQRQLTDYQHTTSHNYINQVFNKNYNWRICFIQKKYAYCNRYFSDMTYTVKLVYETDISINTNQSIIKRITNTIR